MGLALHGCVNATNADLNPSKHRECPAGTINAQSVVESFVGLTNYIYIFLFLPNPEEVYGLNEIFKTN